MLEQRSYDPAGRLAQATDALGHVTAYTYTDDDLPATTVLKAFHVAGGGTTDVTLDSKVYDFAGNVVSESTANGTRTTTSLYDAAGRVAATTLDPAGLNRSRSYTYDATNDVISTTLSAPDGTSQTQTMTYDDASRQLSAMLGSLTQSVTRDARGLVATSTDAAGKTTTNSYDALGELYRAVSPTVSVEANGGAPTNQTPTTDTGYDTFGEATHAKDPNGKVVLTAFNATGTTASVIEPSYTPPGGSVINATINYTYDNLNRLHTMTDALGKVTTTDYDMRSRPIRVTGPTITSLGSQVTRTFYDDLGFVLQSNDPTGAQTTSAYDDLGRLSTSMLAERVPSAQNLTTTFGYDWAGNQTSQTDPANITTSATYDAADQQLSSTDGRNHTTTNTYDGIGRLTRTTDPLSRSVRSSNFTPLSKPQTVTHNAPDGTPLLNQTIGYDNVGRVTSATDPNAHATTFTFDALGRETQMVEPVDATHTLTTTFGYDAVGNQTRITDPNGNATIVTYNSWNLPESRIEPSTPAYPNASDRTWTTKYNANGLQTEVDEPGGVVQTASYNEAGWLTGVNGSGGGAPAATKTFGYDLDGRITSASHPASTVNLSYNDRGEVVNTTGGAGSGSYAYDADGRMTSRTDPGGQSTTFTYDNAGNVATASGFAGGPSQSFTYDNANQLTHTDYGTGNISRDYTYDNLGRLSTDTVKTGAGATLASLVYGYDNNSNVATENTTGLSGAGTNTYSYDWANRLTSWTNPSNTVSNYTWDGNSNRLTSGTTSATYDARNRLQSTSSANGVSDIHLTGAASNSISTPDSAALSSTSEVDVRVKVAMDDWTPTNGAELADKVRETGNQRSWDFWLEPNGTPMIKWSADGTNQLFAHLLTAPGFIDGTTHWIRFTLKTNNGSGGRDIKFYTSSDGTTWTQLGTTITQTGTTSVFDSTAPVELGAYNGVGNAAAKFFAGQVYNGINGTQVANWQANTLNPSTPTPATDSAGNVWTINGTGWTTDLSGSPVTTTYIYTPRGTEASKTVGTTTTNATFDALDRMTTFGTTSYTYDAFDRTASAGSTNFQYAGSEMEPSTAGSWTYYRNPDGSLRGAKNGSNPATALVANQHGDVVASLATNATSLATSTTYDPWGQIASTTGTNKPSVGYQGQYTDPTSNNVDAEARWYDPSTGNFLNRDATNLPATTSANINRDGYANANPVTGSDPTGRSDAIAIGGKALEACARVAAACAAAGAAAVAWAPVAAVVGAVAAFGVAMHSIFGGGDMMQELRQKVLHQIHLAAKDLERSIGYAYTMTGLGSYSSWISGSYTSTCWFCSTFIPAAYGTGTGTVIVDGGRVVPGHRVVSGLGPVIPPASIPHTPPPPNPTAGNHNEELRDKLGRGVTDGIPAINAAAEYLYGPQVGVDMATSQSMGNGPCGSSDPVRTALEVGLAYNPNRREGSATASSSTLAASYAVTNSCSHSDPNRQTERELAVRSQGRRLSRDAAQAAARESDDLALGLTSKDGTELLDPFARRVGAKSYLDLQATGDFPMRNIEWRHVQGLIEDTASSGGRLHFNLEGIEGLAEAAKGAGPLGGMTERELAHICSSPSLRSITTFYGGAAPC